VVGSKGGVVSGPHWTLLWVHSCPNLSTNWHNCLRHLKGGCKLRLQSIWSENNKIPGLNRIMRPMPQSSPNRITLFSMSIHIRFSHHVSVGKLYYLFYWIYWYTIDEYGALNFHVFLWVNGNTTHTASTSVAFVVVVLYICIACFKHGKFELWSM